MIDTVKWHLGDVDKLSSFLARNPTLRPLPPLASGELVPSFRSKLRLPARGPAAPLTALPGSPCLRPSRCTPGPLPHTTRWRTRRSQTCFPSAGARGSFFLVLGNRSLVSSLALPHPPFALQPQNTGLPPPRFTKTARSKLGHQLFPHFRFQQPLCFLAHPFFRETLLITSNFGDAPFLTPQTLHLSAPRSVPVSCRPHLQLLPKSRYKVPFLTPSVLCPPLSLNLPIHPLSWPFISGSDFSPAQFLPFGAST